MSPMDAMLEDARESLEQAIIWFSKVLEPEARYELWKVRDHLCAFQIQYGDAATED